MNRKGIAIHWYMIIFGSFLALGAFSYYYSISTGVVTGKYIGDFQINLIKNFQKVDNVLLYLDQSAKYSLQQSVYDLAKNGGISEIDITETSEAYAKHQCGKYNDAYVWFKLKKGKDGEYNALSCFDESSAEGNLIHMFDKKLDNYIAVSPYDILVDNYNYEIKGNLEIIGKAINPLKFDILRKYSDTTGVVVKEVSKTPEGLIDFTGTVLCSHGTQCSLTEDAYKLLQKAQEEAAKKGISLEVTSAYRSYEQQLALWEGGTPEKYAQRFLDVNERKKYVSNPKECGDKCSHSTAKVVDVRLKGKTMDTMTKQEWIVLNDIMKNAGWVRYGDEKIFNVGERWHFECCGTDRYARAKQQGITSIV